MSRNICVYNEFLTDAHRARIEQTARENGFAVRFFDDVEEAKSFVSGDCEVLYSYLPSLVQAGPHLKWFCCASAGVDRFCQDDSLFQNPDCLLTNSSGAYGTAISEHILMVTLMLLRRYYPTYAQLVRDHCWKRNLPIRSILGSRITVVGTGDLGTSFARRAKALGAASIIGVNRSGRKPDPCYDRIVPTAQLDSVLPETEILVLCLPQTPDTVGILSRERIALLSPESIVVNVGRGSAVDQEALAEALNAGWIFGAALDVVTPEPLPADHPLWETKNLLLTPHCSGDTALGWTCDKLVEMFCEDLANYAAGRPMKHLVDRKRGY